MPILVDFADVAKMLKNCAPGHTLRRTTHGKAIQFNGRYFRSLPKYDEIEGQYVRKLVEHLGIDLECAEKYVGKALSKKKAEAK